MYLNLTINCIFIRYVIIIVLSKSNGFKVGRTCKRGTTSTHVPSSMTKKRGGEGFMCRLYDFLKYAKEQNILNLSEIKNALLNNI